MMPNANEVEEIGKRKKEFDLPEGNKVVFICECHQAFAIIFRNGKQVLTYISNALAQVRAKVLENQMRKLLGNCRIFACPNIASKSNVVESKSRPLAHEENVIRSKHRVYHDVRVVL